MNRAPINLKKQNADPAAIKSAVEYALQVASGFETWMRNFGPDERRSAARPFADVTVLEVGPGKTLGATVLLACGGARVSAADRYLAPWDSDFHGPFYRALRDAVSVQRPDLDPAPIDSLLQSQGFVRGVVACYPFAAEELWKIDRRFDIVVSNAVLEHVQDIEVTAANLLSVTERHGHGFHQVDFRDHQDFTRPLEYLTMSCVEFAGIRQRHFCERGGQWRMSTVAAAFEKAGFRQQSLPNMFAEPGYLADVRPRLHPEFATLTDEDCAAISAFFAVQRIS